MPRSLHTLNKLIQETEAQQVEDRAQLAKLKDQQKAVPSEYTQNAINGWRQTVANGQMDLEDLKAELDESVAFEASEAGKQRHIDNAQRLRAVEALVDVCTITGGRADKALLNAWHAMRKHYGAHMALRTAIGDAYSNITADTGYDPEYQQLYLMQEFSNLRNCGPALAEWVMEATNGYELEAYITVEHGMMHSHREHVTIQQAEGVWLNRTWLRMKEIATRCGYTVHAENDPAQPLVREALLKAVMDAEVK